jgi:hypothetical protein
VPNPNPSYIAGGTIRPSRFVKYTANDFEVAEADANEKIAGISQEGTRTAPIPDVSTNEAAQSGETLQVYGDGEDCLLELGGTVVPGDDLKSDADGKGVVIATGAALQQIGAVALEGGVSGELIRVQVKLAQGGSTVSSS